ncbi:MAG: VOC family protein [Propionibacteriaceae bacterium]|nr:VOC family protein [Propionibacteriaceae bacterium]
MAPTIGSPTWIDLGTTDLDKSMAFYRDLFGWDFTTTGPEFGNYQMIDAGFPIGGLGLNMDMEGNLDESLPVAWTIYLKTDDIAGALEKVAENGGTVFVPPMQIGDMGSMAIVAAPSGAAFGLWQSDTFDGFDTEGRPGASTWFETLTKDYDADAAFYAAVLGWDNVPMQGDAGDSEAPDNYGRYATNFAGEAATAGLCEANAWLPEGVPSFWRVYFKVEDADATVARIQELGGSLLDGPIDSPFGRVATVADSLGGSFQIIA